MKLWNVATASEELKSLVEDGLCNASDPRVLKALNEATRRLIRESDWKGTLRAYRICVDCCCVTMPRDVEAVREVYANCRVGRVEPIWYEYLENGPGIQGCCGGACTKTMIDMGVFPTHSEPKYAWPILVLTDDVSDKGVQVTVRGVDQSLREVVNVGSAEYSPGANLVTDNSCPVYSDHNFLRVTSIQKDRVSKGYIRVFSFCPDTYKYQQISVIHPADLQPGYRRYKIPGQNSGSVGVLAKITANELVHPSDVLPIQNVDALAQMLRAMRSEDAVNLGAAREFRSEAIRQLTQEKRNFDGDQSTRLQVQAEGYALSKPSLRNTMRGRCC